MWLIAWTRILSIWLQPWNSKVKLDPEGSRKRQLSRLQHCQSHGCSPTALDCFGKPAPEWCVAANPRNSMKLLCVVNCIWFHLWQSLEGHTPIHAFIRKACKKVMAWHALLHIFQIFGFAPCNYSGIARFVGCVNHREPISPYFPVKLCLCVAISSQMTGIHVRCFWFRSRAYRKSQVPRQQPSISNPHSSNIPPKSSNRQLRPPKVVAMYNLNSGGFPPQVRG